MAKSKRGGPPKGWKRAEYDLFKRQVANYNRRVRALRKSTRHELLKFAPEPTTAKELLATRGKREAKRIAKVLEQFRTRGLQWTMYQGQPMVKAQKAIIERNLKQENKRRRQLAKKVKEAQGQTGRLPSQIDQDLREEQIEQLTPRRLTDLMRLDYIPIIDRRTINWNTNYISQLEENLQFIELTGAGTEEAMQMVREIEQMATTITPEEFYLVQRSVPEIAITNISDVPYFMNNIAAVHRRWLQFYESRGYRL
jgi:hypothetical protein